MFVWSLVGVTVYTFCDVQLLTLDLFFQNRNEFTKIKVNEIM